MNSSIYSSPIIGVMGNASGEITQQQLDAGYSVGREVALNGMILLTGGCKGVPEAAARGAKSENGMVIGISPAVNYNEHISKYDQSKIIDLYIYTGLGDAGRIPINVRSSDAVILVGGGYGTLAEFSCACIEKKLIGYLSNISGTTTSIDAIINMIGTPKAKLLASIDPKELVRSIKMEINKIRAQEHG